MIINFESIHHLENLTILVNTKDPGDTLFLLQVYFV